MTSTQSPAASTILITGASSGLGAEMARQFAAKGHHLALCARRTERLEELRSEINATIPGCKIAIRALDVNDHDAVFEVFSSFREEVAADGRAVDRVVINAGLGKGAALGTGRFDVNKETAMTNFIGALAQAEAAMEGFRAQDHGHLVMISSISAMRGMPKSMTTYAATKAGVAHLAEGLRTELHGQPQYKISVLYPGYIISEMNDVKEGSTPLMASTAKGVRSMVEAIEKEKKSAAVPGWPWTPISKVLKVAPLGLVRKMV